MRVGRYLFRQCFHRLPLGVDLQIRTLAIQRFANSQQLANLFQSTFAGQLWPPRGGGGIRFNAVVQSFGRGFQPKYLSAPGVASRSQ